MLPGTQRKRGEEGLPRMANLFSSPCKWNYIGREIKFTVLREGTTRGFVEDSNNKQVISSNINIAILIIMNVNKLRLHSSIHSSVVKRIV